MSPKNKVQIITYPDSLGGDLKTLRFVLDNHFKNLFQGGVHLLPPYPSTGDRGYSPITYFEIDPKFGDWEDIRQLGQKYDLMLDLMVNHISSTSTYFLDYLKNGSNSPYADMFLDVEKVWPGGKLSEEDLDKIFLRRALPYSDFLVGDRKEKKTLWTTFGKTTPSDQIDVDVNSRAARELFTKIIEHFSRNHVKSIRLDAVGYVIKKPGTSCFFVAPDIFEFMDWVKLTAANNAIDLLPEVHAEFSTQLELSKRDFWIYDFMLPYFILEALLEKNSRKLKAYLKERPSHQYTMLDCHDGIPVKPDLNGYYDSEGVRRVIEVCLQRGANLSRVLSLKHKDADGFDVHQIRGAYYSMLDEDDDAYFAARAIQLFTPGVPQIYYVGMLAGKNDFAAVQRSGEGREINRHSYTLQEIEREIERPIVKRLMRLIEFRNTCPAFDGVCEFDPCSDHEISITWTKDHSTAKLRIDLKTVSVDLSSIDPESGQSFQIV
jgi:sucrose phosphorylase